MNVQSLPEQWDYSTFWAVKDALDVTSRFQWKKATFFCYIQQLLSWSLIVSSNVCNHTQSARMGNSDSFRRGSWGFKRIMKEAAAATDHCAEMQQSQRRPCWASYWTAATHTHTPLQAPQAFCDWHITQHHCLSILLSKNCTTVMVSFLLLIFYSEQLNSSYSLFLIWFLI